MMTDFTQQQESLLFGAESDIASLATKETARLLVISDSHGSVETVAAILDYFGSSVDALCFCGDGIQDVFTVLSQASADAALAVHIPPVAAFVRGNGDTGSCSFYGNAATTTISVPRVQLLQAARRRIFITHGHNYDVYYSSQLLCDAAREASASIALFGHTHIANVQQKNELLLLNPGSCARPRAGQPPTFCIITLFAAEATVDYSYFRLEKPFDSGAKDALFRPFQPYSGDMQLLW